MGEILKPYWTDQEIQRHLRQARALRAAYVRAALGRLLARCRARFARPRAHASAERSAARLTAGVEAREHVPVNSIQRCRVGKGAQC
jgi:hypothetical protein